MKTLAGLTAVMLITGCATGFNRQDVQERLIDQPIEVTDAAVKAALEKKSQIRFPIKVAVHMAAETYRPAYPSAYRGGAQDWRWTAKDKEILGKWAADLQKAGIVSDMYVMSEMISSSADLRRASGWRPPSMGRMRSC